ncbi:MAG: hypothetical protein COA66_08640 [Arcobacter sp.]|nr:MAG: hypothetical protein COA66_08640 [Arcobacter sp.]
MLLKLKRNKMKINNLKCEIKNKISHNGKVGLILLATDQITLYEFEGIFKDLGILCFPSRVMNEVELTPSVLLKIKDELKNATNTLLPGLTLDAVAFSCTSASMTIGEHEVARIIKQSDPKREIKEVTNPYSAIKNACAYLEIKEVGLITPYSKDVTQGIIDGMKDAGIKTSCASTFNIPNDNVVPDITIFSIKEAVIQMAKENEVDTIFVSCTNLNICKEINNLEEITGKTILSSNQVMAWDILRLLDNKKKISGFGKLFFEKDKK